MPIEFSCVHCGQRLRVPESAAGKLARCPKCLAQMPVPQEPPLDEAGREKGSPAPRNPFADQVSFPETAPRSGDSPDAFNPYAAPVVSAGTAPLDRGLPGGEGLPWEREPMGLGSWWRTARWCLTEPSRAFAAMRPAGDLGRVMLFCGLGLLIGGLAQLVWVLPLMLLGAVAQGDPAGAMAMMAVQFVIQLVQIVIGAVIGATVGLLLGAGIVHLALLLVGGAHRPFETTFRVLGYVNGSTAWLSIFPCAGPLVAVVWSLVIEVAGLAAAQQTTLGRAFLAVFLPLVVCGVLCGLVVALVIFALIEAGGQF